MAAFHHLRCIGAIGDLVVSEEALARDHRFRIPEGIFERGGGVGGFVSVEVKRIPSLAIHGKCTSFPWASTIISAVSKAHGGIVDKYGTSMHHIVLCVTGNRRIVDRVHHHAQRILKSHIKDSSCTCAARRVCVHVLSVSAEVMSIDDWLP